MAKVERELFCSALAFVAPACLRNQGNTGQVALAQVGVIKSSLATTDGQSCYVAQVADIPNVTIPADSIDYLLTNLNRNNADTITIEQSKTLVIFETPTFTARLKKLALPLPDMQEILLKPTLANTVELEFSIDDIMEVCAALELPKQTNDVVQLTVDKNKTIFTMTDVVGNEGAISVTNGSSSSKIRTSFRYSFFKEVALQFQETTYLKLDPNDKLAPVLLTDKNARHAVLPFMHAY